MRRSGRRGLALASLLLLCGCAGARAPAAGPPGSAADPALTRLRAMPDLDGRPLDAATPAPAATLVVVFASWCAPCRRELGLLGQLSREMPALRVIGVNAFEEYDQRSDRERLRTYLDRHAPWLQVVRETPALMAELGGVSKIPTLFLFDRAGRRVAAFRREQRPAPPELGELRAAARAAMQGAP